MVDDKTGGHTWCWWSIQRYGLIDYIMFQRSMAANSISSSVWWMLFLSVFQLIAQLG